MKKLREGREWEEGRRGETHGYLSRTSPMLRKLPPDRSVSRGTAHHRAQGSGVVPVLIAKRT